MPRRVVGGLIQGKWGVQILGLQEIFSGPHFCPSQDARWCDMAEPVPGPTTNLMAERAGTELVVAEMDLDLAEPLP